MSLSSIPSSLRVTVAARDGNQCRYCSLAQVGQGAVFHVDHVMPRSKGGQTILANLVLQCPHCSLAKSNKTSWEDPMTGLIVPLFHPLTEVWSEHFILSADGSCSGTTATGRATVAALRMNDALTRVARAIQIQTGTLRAN